MYNFILCTVKSVNQSTNLSINRLLTQQQLNKFTNDPEISKLSFDAVKAFYYDQLIKII